MEQTKLKIEWWALADIKPYENNPREHEHAVDKMAEVIREFGFRRPLLIRGDGGLIDGHLTLKGALRAGKTHGPVLVCDDLSEDQTRALRLVMNKSAEWANWDEEKLRQELQEIMDKGFDIDLIGFDEDEVRQLLGSQDSMIAGVLDAEARKSLRERFIVPPFSILDTRQGYWQERKASWMLLLPDSREGREDNLTFSSSLDRFCNVGTTSQFDPVLSEVLYRWFCPTGGQILDPFSGGSVRGLVAAISGFPYIGIDLRQEQIDSNCSHWAQIATADFDRAIQPKWICGDSQELDSFDLPQADFVFSCPPYSDLEVYSDNPNDLSNMDYEAFIAAYQKIIGQAVAGMRDNRFACFVVGEIRDKKGNYRRFVSDTIQAFEAAGARYYNELILINVAGSLPVRAAGAFNATRKVGKSHQNVLVFIKGNPRDAAQEIGEIEAEMTVCNKGL